jgi:hypothetical protein
VDGRAEEVILEFVVAGGRRPAAHEVLRVESAGLAWYLTGLPARRPFDEIGGYRLELGPDAHALVALARTVLRAPEPPDGPADAGLELVRVDGGEASWSPEHRPAGGEELFEAARGAIAAAREHPWAVAGGSLDGRTLRLVNRGAHPLAIRDGELRAGWGRPDRAPSALRLAPRPPRPLDLPARLEPGASIETELPDPGEPEDDGYTAVYGLVHLRWQPPLPGVDEWLDGWLVAS